MYCIFSVRGIDVTYLCFRLHNKSVYVKVSLQKMVGRGLVKDLRKAIHLEVDGKHIELPNIKGIIILNIMR